MPGLVPVHQHGIADCIDQQRLDAFGVIVGLEDGIQMTLIALAQVQLAAQCGKGDGGGEVVGACTRYQQPVADRLAARAGLFGSEVTQYHLEQWFFFVHHLGEVCPNGLSVDYRLTAPFEKRQPAWIARDAIALGERVLQR
ncbi:hypothetical protein D3C81_1880590 [compost metagenome]